MKIIELLEYTLSSRQKQNALNNKATIIITMPPEMFLELTVGAGGMDYIKNKTKSKEEYQQMVDKGEIDVHPFLYVQEETGVVKGHEGRSRALAAMQAGDQNYEVAIVLYPPSRSLSIKDVPDVWTAQFNSAYKINFKQEVQKGTIKVLDDNVQRQYQKK